MTVLGLFSPVRLTDTDPRDGILHGRCGDFTFEARLARREVSYGIDPATLYKGYGRVVRLILYRSIGSAAIEVKVAGFDHGWLFGRKNHLQAIRRIVNYLEQRAF